MPFTFGDEPDAATAAEFTATRIRSDLAALDGSIARLDGVMNLVTKAVRAVGRAEPGDRERALDLLDRADHWFPADEDVPAAQRDSVATMRESVERIRATAQALPA